MSDARGGFSEDAARVPRVKIYMKRKRAEMEPRWGDGEDRCEERGEARGENRKEQKKKEQRERPSAVRGERHTASGSLHPPFTVPPRLLPFDARLGPLGILR